jgi:hypothetical protein
MEIWCCGLCTTAAFTSPGGAGQGGDGAGELGQAEGVWPRRGLRSLVIAAVAAALAAPLYVPVPALAATLSTVSVTLAKSSSIADGGSQVTLTAAVSPQYLSGRDGGVVSFYAARDDTNFDTICAGVPLSAPDTASCMVTLDTPATCNFSATYSTSGRFRAPLSWPRLWRRR